MILCKYGCGQEAKFFSKHGIPCCSESKNQCPEIRRKNSESCKNSKKHGNSNNILIYNEYRKLNNISAWNKGLTKDTDERVFKYAKTYHERIKSGEIIKKKHSMSLEAREKISKYQSENLSKHENGFPNVKYYEVLNIKNVTFKLRGKWEMNVALILNNKNILWQKSKPISYLYEFKRNYSPDFYLPLTNEYIEVKGYYSEWDHIKMKCILEQYPNIRIYFINEKRYPLFVENKLELTDDILFSLSDCIIN